MAETSVENQELGEEAQAARERPAGHALSPWTVLVSEPRATGRKIGAGVLLLALICAFWAYWNWGTWGDLSADAGREVYVSLVVKDGGTLYRDVWYPFGPISPYANAWLFRFFGAHIFVLYSIGALSAFGSAIFIFLAGVELSFPLAGWAAGAIVALQAFEPGWSSFPLPYSSAAVYACLFSGAFLWLLLRGLNTAGWWWSISLSILAAMSLLSKPEFGLSCYPLLLLAILYRAICCDRKRAARDVAGLFPGIVLFAIVFSWMISLRGWNFITQENILMWPNSYFMKTFGRVWLATTGFDLSWTAVCAALLRSVLPLGFWVVTVRIARHCRGKLSLASLAITAAIVGGMVGFWMRVAAIPSFAVFLVAVFFPMPMVAYVLLGGLVAIFYLCRANFELRMARLVLLAGFAGLLAFRVLFKAIPEGYFVFYSAPVVLGYFVLISVLLRRAGDKSGSNLRLEYLALAGCIVVTAMVTSAPRRAKARLVPVQTNFGTVWASPRNAGVTRAAIEFLRMKNSRGEGVLMIPEDTMLYVLSGTRAPTRVNAFVPGILAPGAMTQELFREIDCEPVGYLLWSNREFPEYGVPVFGQDFNQELAHFLASHYKPTGLLSQDSSGSGLIFTIWQREDTATTSCSGQP